MKHLDKSLIKSSDYKGEEPGIFNLEGPALKYNALPTEGRSICDPSKRFQYALSIERQFESKQGTSK